MTISLERLSLTQAAEALGVPQHRLIHLCEQEVVIPDVRGAQGRGSSRTFSKRNLFEFAVALEMRRSDLPLSLARAVLQVLRAFETEAQGQIPNFALPDTLRAAHAPKLSVLILDGYRLYIELHRSKRAAVVFGGIEIPRQPGPRRTPHHRPSGRLRPIRAKRELLKARTRTEIDLSAIAAGLPSFA
ncbi:MAG: hypothetical protein ABIR79_09565 [Candidatus Binatia bacterium]